MEKKQVEINFLEINEIISIKGQLYKIVLRHRSNGKLKWFSPCLIKLRSLNPEDLKDSRLIELEDKEKIKSSYSKINLNKEDYPINEETINKKEIFKDKNVK